MNKKGVSIIVGYVLLIVIALSLSVFVYAFLKSYVPKEKPVCKDDVNLIIKDITCQVDESNPTETSVSLLEIQLENRGLFKIERAYLRIGREGEIKKSVTPANPIRLYPDGSTETNMGLNPREETGLKKYLPPPEAGDYILEIQPAFFTIEGNTDPNTLALCPPITQKITCKPI
jgi:hypothetical protein